MLDGEKDEVEAVDSTPSTEATPEYDGGRDISSLLPKAESELAVKTEAPTPITAPTTTADAAAQIARAYKVYMGDKEVTDLSTITAQQLLTEAMIAYQANKQEQKRNFDGVIRNTQQGHYNAEKMNQIAYERGEALRRATELEGKNTAHEAERHVWQQALTAATRGNIEPLKAIVEAFGQALDEPPPSVNVPTVPPGYVSQQEVQNVEAGRQIYHSQILPAAEALGKQFDLPAGQVAAAIMKMVENEPDQFMTPQKLQAILEVEMPYALATLREQYPIEAPKPTQEQTELAAIRAELAELKGKKAAVANTAVEEVHRRRAAAPPGVDKVAAGSGGELESPEFESSAGARGWLRSLK